jgi:hypothetical protein
MNCMLGTANRNTVHTSTTAPLSRAVCRRGDLAVFVRGGSAAVSDKLVEYAVANGVWQYSFLLEDQSYVLEGLKPKNGTVLGADGAESVLTRNEGVTMCRDNVGLLEDLFQCAAARCCCCITGECC